MKENKYRSIEKMIQKVREKFEDHPEIANTFENCYRDTLDKTIQVKPDGSCYVITGDIKAMWLRDSAAQIRPYLILASWDSEIEELICGVCSSHFSYINIDPYANAFNESPNGACWKQDKTLQNDWVWERKYEIDSLCYPLWLSWQLWKQTGCTRQFDERFHLALKKITEVFRREQYHEEKSDYLFERSDTYFTDTLSRGGKGALVKSGIGLTWSGFRPSDDACVYGYLIPSNMFASVVMGYAEEIALEVLKDSVLAREAGALQEEIRTGVERFGITEKEGFGRVYAYETDGFGQFLLMDDANVPSLLSMSFLGYQGNDSSVEENTRRMILSEANPYYYEGREARGIGSPHTPVRYVWHIALAIQGLTARSREEKMELLEMMLRTDGGTGLMHEGFLADDSTSYTREWFSWANAMFCELVLDICGFHLK